MGQPVPVEAFDLLVPDAGIEQRPLASDTDVSHA
jgi:hypothetical protein